MPLSRHLQSLVFQSFRKCTTRTAFIPQSYQKISTHQYRNMSSSAMGKRLSGKLVMITGATAGIGKATAFEFARTAPDIKLLLTGRRIDRLESLAQEIQKECSGVKVKAAKLDVSHSADVRRFFESLEDEWQDIDILVNNAGLVKGMEHVGDITEEDLNIMLLTNVTGLVNVTQAVLPTFKSKNSGDIINIGSIAGREAYAGGSIYCATKAAVRSISESMRKELVNTNIRVMEIAPGQVETEFSVVRFRGDVDRANKEYEGLEPLTPEDIAEIVVFTAGRRENVVIAETVIYPTYQGSATIKWRKDAPTK